MNGINVTRHDTAEIELDFSTRDECLGERLCQWWDEIERFEDVSERELPVLHVSTV